MLSEELVEDGLSEKVLFPPRFPYIYVGSDQWYSHMGVGGSYLHFFCQDGPWNFFEIDEKIGVFG